MSPCKALSSPDSMWSFCPSTGADVLFVVLFSITASIHFVQMIVHRKFYSWVITTSAILQILAYVFRLLSIHNPESMGLYSAWFVIIMIAPIWTNAYAYMVLGRMVYNFLPSASVLRTKAWQLSKIFVSLDIIAFFVQVVGAAMASSSNNSNATAALNGLHIYMGGVAFQLGCIVLFLAMAIRFHTKILPLGRSQLEARAGLLLLYAEYTVVTLIAVRICFRLIEYSHGLQSTIPNHEVYQYVFDSTVMFIALVVFNAIHPGRLMPGQESNLPGRKQRKTLRAQGREFRGRFTQIETLHGRKDLESINLGSGEFQV